MTYPPQGGSQQRPPGGPYGPPGQQYGRPEQGGYGGPGQQSGQQYGLPVPGGYGQPGEQYGPPYGAPPGYGQQPGPDGQPFGAAPKKSRTGLILSLVILAVVLVAAAIVIPLLLGSKVLDRAAAERDVAGQFQQREGVGISLTCDDDMKVADGRTYTCGGTTDDGEHVTLTLTITDAKADPPTYTWSES